MLFVTYFYFIIIAAHTESDLYTNKLLMIHSFFPCTLLEDYRIVCRH